MSKEVSFGLNDLLSIMFIDRKECHKSSASGIETWSKRKYEECENELRYMLDYLSECAYIKYSDGCSNDDWAYVTLTPKGYSRIDLLQKNTAHGNKVLVAMKFGDDTKELREAIRKGITDSGYNAVFIDEVQHNDLLLLNY